MNLKVVCPNCKAINPQFGLKCHNCGTSRMVLTSTQVSEVYTRDSFYMMVYGVFEAAKTSGSDAVTFATIKEIFEKVKKNEESKN